MTEPSTPSTNWWSQPTPTAPLPEPVGSVPEPAAPQAPGRRRRPGASRALLLALALVAAGGTGGAVVAAVDGGTGRPTSSVTSSSGSGTTVSRVTGTTAVPSTTAGTPEGAAATIGPSVVTIEVTGTAPDTGGFGGTSGTAQSDTGSGIVLSTDGYIVTNNHVVAAAAQGGSVHVTLRDGRTVAAAIVGRDTTDDLAVIRITGESGLTAATFADSDTLKVGQTVLAVGAPLGLSNTVTEGIVSTLHRPVRTGESGATAQSVIDAVQTDAAINPGNSGGALVDLAGHVVGINSAIATTGSSGSGQSGSIGVGFAIPSNDAARVAQQLIKDGHATHAQVGVSAGDAASTTDGAPGLGAAVGQVVAGGPADKAGLRRGDVVTQVDDRRVTDADSLIVAIRSHQPGSTVRVSFVRGGQPQAAAVTLGSATS